MEETVSREKECYFTLMPFSMSEGITEITKALVAFDKAMEGVSIKKTGQGVYGNFANLEVILPAIAKPLSDNGLSLRQFPCGDDKLTTLLAHESGEFMMCTVDMVMDKRTAQGFGSALTYNRRYGIVSILKLNTETDDDGQVAEGAESNPAEKKAVTVTTPFVKKKGKW